MSEDIPNIPPESPDPEALRLKALFDELRKNQLTLLGDAGKRVIELSTGMLGIIFAVIAFGKDFPPPYLQDAVTKNLAVGVLLSFLLALLAGFMCVQPREYKDYPNNVSKMREQLTERLRVKAGWFRAGSVLFVVGSFLLVVLLAVIIL